MFMAAGLMAKSKIPELGPKLRWFALGTVALMGLTSILGIILSAVGRLGPEMMWSAIYTLIIAVPIFLFEFPVAPVVRILPTIVQKNYYLRILIYVVLSICTFFNSATIISGVALILLGIGYGIAGFRGETAPDIPAEGSGDTIPTAGGEPPKVSMKERMTAGVKGIGAKLDNIV